jgi:hypothetical protein
MKKFLSGFALATVIFSPLVLTAPAEPTRAPVASQLSKLSKASLRERIIDSRLF